jgi:hypothetical protein
MREALRATMFRQLRHLLALALALACSDVTQRAAPQPQREQAAHPRARLPEGLPEHISIRSVQAARRGTEQTLDIEQTSQGFKAGERRIDAALIEALLRAASAPLEPELNAERLRPLIGDVRAEAEKDGLSPHTAQHFAERVLQRENLQQVLKRLQATKVLDDYPGLHIDMLWASGATLELSSTSRAQLMLPWSVKGFGTTWNPSISAAVSALLPEVFLNRDRVLGKHLTGSIARYGRELFEDEIGAEEAAERHGAALERLRQRFRIEESSVSRRYRLNTRYGDGVWCGKLFAPGSEPFGFSLCLSTQQQLRSFEPFLRDADSLLTRARQVPWLRHFAEGHADAEILVEYLGDRSLGDYARGTLLYDIAHGKHPSALDQLTDELLQRSLGVTVRYGGESGTWIVLPDGRGLLRAGKPVGALEPDLESGQLIEADGSGGVTEAERQAQREAQLEQAQRALRQAEFEQRVQTQTRSIRSSFAEVRESARTGTLTDDDRRALDAPFHARGSAPSPSK